MSRTTLVTGAARGIGAAIAERLRADGCEVVTLDRAAGCDHRIDLRSDPLPELTDVDICISNAAITDTVAPAHRMEAEAWQRDIEVNLSGAFRAIQSPPRTFGKCRPRSWSDSRRCCRPAGWLSLKRWRRWSLSSPRTPPATSPARRSASTAGCP